MTAKGTATNDADIVVVGAGLGGLVCAVTAAARGLRPIVLERSELFGGAAAYSGGQVWVPANDVAARAGTEDSVEAALEYVVDTASEHPELLDLELAAEWLGNARLAARALESTGAVRWAVIPDYPDYYYPNAPGSLGSGRYLTSAPSLLAELGDDAKRLRRSPHFPSGITYVEMLGWGGMARRSNWDADLFAARRAAGVVTVGEGLVAQLFRAAVERGVRFLFGHRAVAPIRDGDDVVGIVSETPSGAIEFVGPVVLASSTFEWNAQLVERFYNLGEGEFGCLAPTALTGDAIVITEEAGGAVRAFPRHLAPMLPGYRTGASDDTDPGYRTCFEHCLPHAIIVDASGRRFCDDSFYRAITIAVLGPNPNHRRFFLIWDEQHHRRYGLGQTAPGEPYPASVCSASSLRVLGPLVGVDGQQLESTVREFNDDARNGQDPLFGRGANSAVRRFRGDPEHQPNPLLGPIEEAPYFAMELQLVGTGIGSAGAVTGRAGQVLCPEGEPVRGLYAIGPAAAPLHAGSSYNSGYTLSRSMTYGYLAALHVADRHAVSA